MSCVEKKLINHDYSHAPQHIKSLAGYDDLCTTPIYVLCYDRPVYFDCGSLASSYRYISTYSSSFSAIHFQSAGLHYTRLLPACSGCKDNAINRGSPYSSHNTRDSAVDATTYVETKGGFRLLAPQQASIHLRMMSPFITWTSSTLQCQYQYQYQYQHLYHHHYYSI